MTKSRVWQLQDAKNRLSQVVDDAVELGPQVITRRGEATAVVVSFAEWTRVSRKRTRLIDVLRRAPRLPTGLDVTRSKDLGRDPKL